jgi:hypothetical protein
MIAAGAWSFRAMAAALKGPRVSLSDAGLRNLGANR